jgi:two-component system response regulator YesN
MEKTVLLTDDNYICVKGIEQSVDWAALGIDHIHCAYDGQSALEYLSSHPVDILVSDISMPGITGLELSERALLLNPSLKVILISAYDEFEYARKAVRLGAYDYIEKPINYEYLSETVAKALAEQAQEKKNLEILKKSRPAMEEQFFRLLIQPNPQETQETLELYAQYLELDLDCSYCAALRITVEDQAALKQKLGIEEYYVKLLSLENELRHVCNSFKVNYVLKDLNGFICILGDDSASRIEFKKNILSSFSQIIEDFSGRFDLVIGLGKIVKRIWELSASYMQALKALDLRFFFPEQKILENTQITGKKSSFIPGLDTQEDELIQLLCKNDLNGIHEWIIEFTDTVKNNYCSKNMVYTLFYSLISRILKFTYELNISNENLEDEITTVFSDSEKFKTIDKFSEWLYTICMNICKNLQNSVLDYHQSLCQSAVAYINKNYGNSDLSLNDIADHVQITPAYLSTLFKQYRHQNISSYITDVRIDASCHLLENTSLSLKIISMQVGYANQYYFSSCFKKKTGMTPSAYREEYQQTEKFV